MSESDTMFNERDRRCAAVQPCSLPIQVMTTGPLPAPSKCNSGRFNAWGHSSTHWTNLWRWWSGSPILRTSPGRPGLEVGLKVNTKVYLDVLKSVVIHWCIQVACGRPWVWQQNSAPVHMSKETQNECYDFVPFSHWLLFSPNLNPLDYFVWSYVENITNMTSHSIKASLIAAIRRVFVELPPALVERHAPSSGSVSMRWLRLKAATLNRCQFYYIIKLPELTFSMKVLK